jgi:hypothetical protein
MIVAIVSTKLPIWTGQDFWIFHVPKLDRYGFWSMVHECSGPFYRQVKRSTGQKTTPGKIEAAF